ncbi:HEPN domain-containing protein [Chryseobacterium limigenitum]|uniref:Uncharacterized protein n=1 Tax=Chryseobacterium limigenitum TaxID=1612149 RepID=A0A1K2IHZ6_9FLAO|nr:HEPN domain-containing protein [Chryseobacterium limigenitum]SFZ92060.1 hypothetical protein SAMN05216324_10396 [Chryseobacterium limigenitum]
MESNNFTQICIAEIIGVSFPAQTTFSFNELTITNNLSYLNDNFKISEELFTSIFGALDYNVLKKRTLLIANIEANENHNYIQNFLIDILNTLWRIKDNNIYINQFYYFPVAEPFVYFRGKLNFNLYTSSGNIEDIHFNENDFISIDSLFTQRSNFLSKDIVKKDYPKENIEGIDVYVGQKLNNHNDLSRFARSNMFLNEARKQSTLPLKITNYISFFECLFSTTSVEISHQVSERISFFLNRYDQNIKKIEIYKIIKSCYAIRSKYIHGDKLENKHKELINLQSFSNQIDKLARLTYNNILDNNLVIFNDEKGIDSYLQDLVFGS